MVLPHLRVTHRYITLRDTPHSIDRGTETGLPIAYHCLGCRKLALSVNVHSNPSALPTQMPTLTDPFGSLPITTSPPNDRDVDVSLQHANVRRPFPTNPSTLTYVHHLRTPRPLQRLRRLWDRDCEWRSLCLSGLPVVAAEEVVEDGGGTGRCMGSRTCMGSYSGLVQASWNVYVLPVYRLLVSLVSPVLA
jgi:hypothetical protein